MMSKLSIRKSGERASLVISKGARARRSGSNKGSGQIRANPILI